MFEMGLERLVSGLCRTEVKRNLNEHAYVLDWGHEFAGDHTCGRSQSPIRPA